MKNFNVDTAEDALRVALLQIERNGNWVGDKKEIINYSVEIQNPCGRIDGPHERAVSMLDEHHGEDHYEITTNWTFPTDSVSRNLTGEPTPTDETGEYYDKLCSCEKGNQLQSLVDKVDQWGRNNRTVAQVFNVDRDLNAMFPPCMLDLQVLYRNGAVNLTAHFRSHTVAKSYYGDITALCRLQEWLSNEVGATVGVLNVISGSIHVRKDNNEHKLAERMRDDLF